MTKVKNIIIFLTIGVILVLAYVFIIKKPSDEAPLVSSSGSTVPNTATSLTTSNDNSPIDKDFLPLLLNITNIKLNDALFSDTAFSSLHDSTIILVPDGTEGRPNPFAPLGVDVIEQPPTVSPPVTPPPATPPPVTAPPVTTPPATPTH